MIMTQPTLEQFLNHVKNHELTIHQNNGVYRHLTSKNPDGGGPYFDIATFPNHLVITARIDGFSYALVLSKRYDMFDYFRDYFRDGNLKIFPELWSEKIKSTSNEARIASCSEFDIDKVKELAKDYLRKYLKNQKISKEDRYALNEKFESEILDAEDEYEIVEAIRHFYFNDFEFADFWGGYYRKYRYEYIWLCYAIVWGIKKFDEVSI